MQQETAASFIQALQRAAGVNKEEGQAAKPDSGTMAALRRSLAHPSGHVIIPLVENFISRLPWYAEDKMGERWSRQAYYLLAGLYAQSYQNCRHNPKVGNLGESFGNYYQDVSQRKENPSLEARFVTLLDADETQLSYRLRQIIALLKSRSTDVNWQTLLMDIDGWPYTEKRAQRRWARSFYLSKQKSDTNDTQTTAAGA